MTTKTNTLCTWMLAATFTGSAAAILMNSGDVDENTHQACVANIIIPQTIEQYEYLQKNAAEAYKRRDPVTMERLEDAVKMFSGGKPYEIIGMSEPTKSTLPDGSTRLSPCVTYKLTN